MRISIISNSLQYCHQVGRWYRVVYAAGQFALCMEAAILGAGGSYGILELLPFFVEWYGGSRPPGRPRRVYGCKECTFTEWL